MWKRYRGLAALLCLVIALRHVAAVYSAQPPALGGKPWTSVRDAESRLAAGKRIELCRAGMFELELIAGIADALAFEILRKKRAVLAAARALPPGARHRALELVHGIGRKRAQSLSRHLALHCRRPYRRTIPQAVREQRAPAATPVPEIGSAYGDDSLG